MPRKKSGLVSIAVYRKTRDRLKDFGRKGIIYDEIIPQPNILLKAANTRENTLYLMVMKCVI